MLYSSEDVDNCTFKEGIVSILIKDKAQNLSDLTLYYSFPVKANYLYARALIKKDLLTIDDILPVALAKKIKIGKFEIYKKYNSTKDAKDAFEELKKENKTYLLNNNYIIDIKTNKVVKILKYKKEIF